MINKEQEDFLTTLEQSLGNITIALKKSGIERDLYESWLENIFFKERIKQINESSLDFVEQQLMKQIQEGNVAAITYFLKTKGKKRGY